MHRRLFRITVITAVISLVLVAGLVGGVRLLLPEMERYRAEVEAFFTLTLDRPVRIGGMSLGWQGWGPVLRVSDVLLMDEDGEAERFRLRKVTVSLDPVNSARSRAIKPGRLDIEGVKLWVRRYENGRLTIGGIDAGGSEAEQEQGDLWLLPPGVVTLHDAQLVWEDDILRPGLPPVRLRNVDMMLSNEGRDYRLQLEADLSVGSGKRVSGVFEMQGTEGFVGNLSGRAYLEVEDLVLSEWLARHTPLGDSVKQAYANLRLWADVDQSRLENARGELHFHHLNLRDLPSLEAGNAEFRWQRQERGWALDVERLRIDSWNDTPLESGLSLVWDESDADQPRLAGVMDGVDLDNLLSLMQDSKAIPPELMKALTATKPGGEVKEARFLMDIPHGQPPQFRSWLNIGSFHAASWQGAPAVAGLELGVYADQDGGLLDINGQNAVIDATSLFRWPFMVDEISGQLSLLRRGEDWLLYTPELALRNQDIATKTRMALRIPGDGSIPHLDLMTDFVDGDGSRVAPYLPVTVMPDASVKWLDRGIVSARILYGGVLYRGALDGMPFRDHSGRLEIRFDVEDAVIDYMPDWPRLEEGAAEVAFVNSSLDIQANAGKILAADLPEVHVWVPNLLKTSLHVQGRAEALGNEMLGFLVESPLKEDVGVFFENMNISGKTRLDLGVFAPLSEGGPVKIDGKIHLAGNRMTESELDVAFSDLNGVMRFTQDGLYAKGIKGKFKGRPVQADVYTPKGGGLTEVSLRTRNSADELAAEYLSGLDQILVGEADWVVKLGFETKPAPGKSPGTTLTVVSDLHGVTVKAPAPFAKPASARRALLINTRFQSTGIAPLRVRYGDIADLVVGFKPARSGAKPEIHSAELRFGGAPARLPSREGFRVAGTLQSLSTDNLPELPAEDEDSGVPPLREVDVRIEELALGDTLLHDAHLLVQKTPTGWEATVHSKEAVGVIQVPQHYDNAQPLVARLQRLHLAAANEATEPPAKVSEASTLDPRGLPPLRLSVEDFQVGDMNFGRLDVDLVQVPGGLKIARAESDNGKLNAVGTGDWTVDGRQQISRLDITLTTPDLGGTMDGLGFNHAVSGGEGIIKLQGGWMGTPMDFALEALEGDLEVEFKGGRLLDVDPGTGGRVFGLFSITSLPRRLKLDFSDMFSKGFSFDEIKGSFILSEGDAYTSNLYLQGPPARVEISGRTGFANQDYDQQVVVTPDVSSTVAAASALVINPAVGAAVFLVQKLLKNPLDQITRFRYEIRGPWDDPDIAKLGEEQAEKPDVDVTGSDVWGLGNE